MITVVLPAFNEEEALPPLLDSIAAVRSTSLSDLRVFVVDDGSTDSTAPTVCAKAEQYPWLRLVQHEENQGLSGAIRTGFRAALADAGSGDIVITLDADNTQPPQVMIAMVERIAAGDDVVVASRFRPGAEVHGVPLLRQLYSLAMSILFQLAFPVQGVRDYSCGYRAYRASLLQRAYDTYGDQFITEKGFACMVEILFQLSHLKPVTFSEVPFVLRYDLKPTETKMKVLRNIKDTLRVALRHRFSKNTPG